MHELELPWVVIVRNSTEIVKNLSMKFGLPLLGCVLIFLAVLAVDGGRGEDASVVLAQGERIQPPCKEKKDRKTNWRMR